MPITFENDTHKQIYEKMVENMRELFGEYCSMHPDYPRVDLQYGSAFVVTICLPWNHDGKEDAIVRTRCYVVTGAELRAELLEWLLKQNYNVRFGAFGIDDENDIFFQHTIVGSTMEKEELRAMVMAVIWTSDESDDEITSRWGGMRYTERLAAPAAPAPPAEPAPGA
ncbi:YbjN domain-containing protein [bacterium]|nr:YbjN domain-containing protein [bacterium]